VALCRNKKSISRSLNGLAFQRAREKNFAPGSVLKKLGSNLRHRYVVGYYREAERSDFYAALPSVLQVKLQHC
jgi:hypothetical protein